MDSARSSAAAAPSTCCPAARRSDTLRGLAEGSVDIVIGTHALLRRRHPEDVIHYRPFTAGEYVIAEDEYFDYLIGVKRNWDLLPSALRGALYRTSLLFLGFRIFLLTAGLVTLRMLVDELVGGVLDRGRGGAGRPLRPGLFLRCQLHARGGGRRKSPGPRGRQPDLQRPGEGLHRLPRDPPARGQSRGVQRLSRRDRERAEQKSRQTLRQDPITTPVP